MRCPFRSPPPYAGKCLCTVSGRDIIEHATEGSCPKGYYTTGLPDIPPTTGTAAASPHPPDIPLAGDVVEAIAKRIGADRLAKLWERWTGTPCGCAERKAKLNAASVRLLKWLGR